MPQNGKVEGCDICLNPRDICLLWVSAEARWLYTPIIRVAYNRF